MENLALQFFPYPHVVGDTRRQGALVEWPERCSNCDRQCENSAPGHLGLCSYGLNFLRVDEDLLIAGLAVQDYPHDTPARRKMLRRLKDRQVSSSDLKKVADLCADGMKKLETQLAEHIEQVIRDYRNSKGYQEDIVERLRPEMQQALAQVHDYKQFVRQIRQNMDVHLEARFPNKPLTEKVALASHEEEAIYWAAEMMDDKLEAVAFLQFPERIHEVTEQGRFRLHGMVLKYVRIYQRNADARDLKISVSGECWADIGGNTRALGIIPHTLIDNAVKYAPENSEVEVLFDEREGEVELSVSSFGPEIAPNEEEAIFDPFVRGKAARKMRTEGTGFGLAAAQTIAVAHDTRIAVRQLRQRGAEDTFKTTFSITFRPIGAGNQDMRRALGR